MEITTTGVGYISTLIEQRHLLTLRPTWYGTSWPILWNVISGAGSPLDRHRRTAGRNSCCFMSLSSSICGLTAHVINVNNSIKRLLSLELYALQCNDKK